MVRNDLRGRLDLDRDAHVVHDEIHLDTAGKTPVGEPRELPGIRVVRGQLVKHPVLEGLAEELRPGPEAAAASEMVHDPDVAEVELGRGDDSSLRTFRVAREPAPEKRVLEDLEIALDRVARNT